MANMSYCMFRNTNEDLYDCVSKLEEMNAYQEKSLSDDELRAAKEMYELCKEYIQLYEELF